MEFDQIFKGCDQFPEDLKITSLQGHFPDKSEKAAKNRTEFYQDGMEGVVKSLRCSAAKHPVRNEQYVVGHCHSAIRSHFGAMDVLF
ncbi:hypothetical protein TNCV_2651071 [Trichonephila clavipes]|nr:hypothetical protein TNCV_2651071 [Trichonephila clavipes]